MGKDLQEGDVDKRPGRQPLQHRLDESASLQLSLDHNDADANAERRHHSEDGHVERHPQGLDRALNQLHRQTEDDDALVDQDGDADLQHLSRETREVTLTVSLGYIHHYIIPIPLYLFQLYIIPKEAKS